MNCLIRDGEGKRVGSLGLHDGAVVAGLCRTGEKPKWGEYPAPSPLLKERGNERRRRSVCVIACGGFYNTFVFMVCCLGYKSNKLFSMEKKEKE